MDNKQRFMAKLVEICGLSLAYADAAFYTIEDWMRKQPEQAAIYYQRRFFYGYER